MQAFSAGLTNASSKENINSHPNFFLGKLMMSTSNQATSKDTKLAHGCMINTQRDTSRGNGGSLVKLNRPQAAD
jgi:hypothetical protein